MNSPLIAAQLMHGRDFNGIPQFPCIVSEKLNGLRALYVPAEKRFYSKTGTHWHAAVTAHISIPPHFNEPVDGEFFHPDLNLQSIVERMSVNKRAADERWPRVDFYAFDLLNNIPASLRKDVLLQSTGMGKHFIPHAYYAAANITDYSTILDSLRARNAEGAMVIGSSSSYLPGRGGNLMKVKFFHHDEFLITHFADGQGKAQGVLATVTGRVKRGKHFEVGTFQMDYDQRELLFNTMEPLKYMMRVKYLTLSTDGLPQNASVEAIWKI